MTVVRQAGRFIGRVQGVGFRMFVEKNASALGLTGWVKNMPDGSVVMEAQGSEDKLEELKTRIREGNNLIRVEHMAFDLQKNIEGEAGFEIRR